VKKEKKIEKREMRRRKRRVEEDTIMKR